MSIVGMCRGVEGERPGQGTGLVPYCSSYCLPLLAPMTGTWERTGMREPNVWTVDMLCTQAVVVGIANDMDVQLSTKALELVPGQMKTDKQILITDISQQSAVAIATMRFEQKPDGTYQPMPRLIAKSTETTAAAEPASRA
ncbi:hypothetical protein HaLaN_17037 [Haematococcus lacustris]|uniref:Uncharacterized protein n=1 Tax=Haematococcus lacustris TaxID=44745 RepID=A0A699ZBI6_HAELA|nr:hypothetical protein HaLaN_17037 [Haematococcus lacustris]